MPLLSWNVFDRNELTNNSSWFTKIWKTISDALIAHWGPNNTWANLVLLNSWVASGSPVPAVRVRDGIAHFRGVVANGTTGTAVFALPASIAPAAPCMFSLQSNTGAARGEFFAGGSMVVTAYGTGGSNAFIYLGSVMYPVD